MCIATLLSHSTSLLMPRVHAQADAAATTASARSLFEEGVALAEAGKWAEAADKFQRSLSLRPSPVVAFNYATALMELGRLVEASEVLEGIRRDASTTAQMKRRVDTLLETLRPQLAWLTVQLAERENRVAVLDGQALPDAAIGVPRAVDPGKRTLEVRVDGRVVWSRTITVTPGESEETLIDLPAHAPATQPQAEQHSSVPTPAQTAAQGQPAAGPSHSAAPQQALARDDSDSSGPWLWVGIGGAVVVVAVVAIIAASSGGTEAGPTFQGDLDTIVVGAQ